MRRIVRRIPGSVSVGYKRPVPWSITAKHQGMSSPSTGVRPAVSAGANDIHPAGAVPIARPQPQILVRSPAAVLTLDGTGVTTLGG